MMRGPAVNIEIVQGKDQWYGFRLYRIPPREIVTSGGVTTDPGTPLDLTGWTFRAAFASPRASGTPQMSLTNSNFFTRTDLPGREGQLWLIMHCPNAKTALMTAGGEYDVTAIDTNGYQHEIAHGTYILGLAAKYA